MELQELNREEQQGINGGAMIGGPTPWAWAFPDLFAGTSAGGGDVSGSPDGAAGQSDGMGLGPVAMQPGSGMPATM